MKILGKVENLVCRILRVLSTENLNWIDVHEKRGKCVVVDNNVEVTNYTSSSM